ncbi:ComEA family DNA-binding protein [Rubrobacter aplysinae]|uniref:ComEA family DNA-binding protein n=1 Tax=Rubrobacter aplysinae TaxID=909625 RepID=UPI00069DB676|nr:helix-hairpin-helix domain-containing protein [Rubrobacter aplysinae]
MPGWDFESATTRNSRSTRRRFRLPDHLTRYKPQITVSSLVVILLLGGAFYSARLSESAPEVVYSASLEEVAEESGEPLRVDLNTADGEALQDLPGVGPATAEDIIDYRRSNGLFGSVEELEEVDGIGPKTLEEIEPLAEV